MLTSACLPQFLCLLEQFWFDDAELWALGFHRTVDEVPRVSFVLDHPNDAGVGDVFVVPSYDSLFIKIKNGQKCEGFVKRRISVIQIAF